MATQYTINCNDIPLKHAQARTPPWHVPPPIRACSSMYPLPSGMFKHVPPSLGHVWHVFPYLGHVQACTPFPSSMFKNVPASP